MNTLPTKSGTSRGLLVTILAVAAVIVYVMFGFLPVQKGLMAKRRELHEKQQFIANADLKSATVPQLEQQLLAVRQHVDGWRQHTRAESGAVALMGELASLAAKSGVILHRLTPQDHSTMETLRQQPLEIEVEGAYSQVIDFLRGIESRPETVWVPHIEMKPAREDGGNVQCAR